MQEETKDAKIDYPFFSLNDNVLITEEQQQSMTDIISVTTELRADKRINELRAALSDVDREIEGLHNDSQYYAAGEVLKDYEDLEIEIQKRKNKYLAEGEKKLNELRREIMLAINQISAHKVEVKDTTTQEGLLESMIKRLEDAIAKKNFTDITDLLMESKIRDVQENAKNTISSLKSELPSLDVYSVKLKEIISNYKTQVEEESKRIPIVPKSTESANKLEMAKTVPDTIVDWRNISQYCIGIIPAEKTGISYNCSTKTTSFQPLEFTIAENFGICQWENNIIICGGNDKESRLLNEVLYLTLPSFKAKMPLPGMLQVKRKTSLVYIHSNIIISLGGEGKINDTAVHLADCECYLIGDKSWKAIKPLSTARRSISAFNIKQKWIFALNGKTNAGSEIICEKLPLKTKLGIECEPWQLMKIKGMEPRVTASVAFEISDSGFLLLGGEISYNNYSDKILKATCNDDSIVFEQYGRLPRADYFYQRPIMYDNSSFNVIGFIDNRLYKSMDDGVNPYCQWTEELITKS